MRVASEGCEIGAKLLDILRVMTGNVMCRQRVAAGEP